MIYLRLLFTDPALRLAAMLLFMVGAIMSGFAPHVSVFAIQRFGMADTGLAVLMVASVVVSVFFSILIGIRTDQTGERRTVALTAAMLWVLGQAIMTLAPSAQGFVLTQALLFPFAASLFGQIFALARLAASAYPVAQRDAILSAVRAMFAAAFVVVLPVWAVVFEAGVDAMVVYPVSLVMAMVVLALIWFGWPAKGATVWADQPSGLSFRLALRELARRRIALRVLALGAVMAAGALYLIVIGLLMATTPGRGAGDAALYIGLVAGLEVPLMLLLVPRVAHLQRTWLILAGAGLYAVHLALLPVLAAGPFVWLLILPAALGGSLTLTIPIAYLQDLMATRPGAGSSLISLHQLAAHILAAGCYATGTALSGYGLVMALGATLSVGGAAFLVFVDLQRRDQSKNPGPA